MLRLSNPDLPTTDQGFVVEQNRILQLYSDPEQRGAVGVIAQIRRSRSNDEIAYLGRVIDKGYFYKLTFLEEFNQLSLPGYRQVNLPSQLLGDRLWRKNSITGIYSRQRLSESTIFNVVVAAYRRDTSTSLDVTIPLTATPTKVTSLGYEYSPGTGTDQWEYADSVLTIHTNLASQIQPNQEILIEGTYEVAIAAPTLQILSYQVEKDSLILAVDLLGRSFTPAYSNYAPRNGEFTLSTEGVLNLYVSMEVLLPEVGVDPSNNRVVNTGTLTYSRPTA